MQKDDWFVDIVLIFPPAKDISMSGQDVNGLINASLSFGGEEESGSTTCMNRIVFVGQSATVTLPPISALLEARVAQQIIRVFSAEDTR